MKNKHTTSSIIALMAGMALATPLMAAETTPASGSQLEEVIVTAQKRAENVQATAIAITAVTGTNLAKDRVLSLEALVRMKLTSYRDKDRTHLRDMLDVGLLDATWPNRYPTELAARLQHLIDTPDG